MALAVRSLSSVQKSLAVLDLLGSSKAPVRSIDLARSLGESAGTMHQRLVTLGESGLLSLLRTKGGDILEDIRKTGDLTADTEKKLKAVTDDYAKTFA